MGVLFAAYAAYGLIHDFLDFLRDVAYTREHADPVLNFLAAALNFLTTGLGNLVAIIIAAILILWALQTQPRQAQFANTATSHTEEIEGLRNQPEGEGLRRDWLKRECRDMAAYLRWFLKDHEHETDDEIVDLYRERYLDKVSVLLQQLEQQSLYPPAHLKSFEIAADKYPRSPMAIRRLAGTLGSIGQEI